MIQTKRLLLLTLMIALVIAALDIAACAQNDSNENGESEEGALSTSYDSRLDGLVEDGTRLSDEEKSAISENTVNFTAHPQMVLQNPELPSGCEIAALTAALQCLGVEAKATVIADKYLVVDGDYEHGYIASPRTDEGGGFPPGVVDAANAFLEDTGQQLRAHDLTGSSFDAITALVDAGYPVCVWTTLSQTPPRFSIGTWYINEHCVCLYEIGEETVLMNDPLKGIIELDRDTFEDVYKMCGHRALIVR